MRYSDNYNLNKPERLDQYNVDHWNDNTDIIDEELKKRENDNVALNNPVYTPSVSDSQLVSGESIFTAFGKLSKIVSSFITHKATETSVHGSTPLKTSNKIIERDSNGRAKIEAGVDIEDIANLMQIQNSALNKKFIGVKTVATSNITLFGEQVIDNLSCVINDIVLVINQTTSTENGVYIVQSGAWTRHPDYNTADKINNTLVCVYLGSNRDKVYKTSVKTYTEGTTVLSFDSSDYPISEGAKKFWRHKIDACQENKPAIGVPTIWFGNKPSWALDFGNGGSYSWSNYPELFYHNEFMGILQILSSKGWMNAPSTSINGTFTMPDLRGIVPIGYGTNQRRTTEVTAGGALGEHIVSKNKYHNHGVTLGGTNNTGFTGDAVSGWATLQGKYNNLNWNDSSGALGRSGGTSRYPDSVSNSFSGNPTLTFNMTSSGSVSVSVNYNGASTDISKPPTIGVMWIVRYE